MPSIILPVTPGASSTANNIGNFVAQIQGAAANAQAVPGDPLGVKTLGRNTGLALQQISAAINGLNPGSVEITQDIIDNLDTGVQINGTPVSY